MSCHRPYPNLEHFKLNDTRCNSCQRRLEKQKLKRRSDEMEEEEEEKKSFIPGAEKETTGQEDETLLPLKKRKRARKLSDDEEDEVDDDEVEEDDDYDDEGDDERETWDEEEMKMMSKFKNKDEKKKNKRNAKNIRTETLLNYLNEAAVSSSGKKHQGSLELGKRKKRKYNRKTSSLTNEEADLVEERLLRSLLEYKKSFPTRSSIQFFLLTK